MNKRGSARVMALFLAVVFVCLSGGALAAGKPAAITRDGTKVHAKPKASSRILGTLDKGTEVTLLKVSDGLARIQYAGKTGYVKKAQVKLIAQTAKTPVKADPVVASPKAVTSAKAEMTRKTTRRAVAYLEPRTSCKKRTVVRKGTSLSILGASGDFYKVKRAGQVAYMLKAAFEPVPEKTEPAGEERLVQSKSKVFRRASRAAKVMGTLQPGDRVTVLKESGAFARVRVNGQTGYVLKAAFDEPKDDVKPEKTPPPAAPSRNANQGKADTVIKAALSQLGKRYVYGTVGPDTFDCSGLTYYAFKQVGLSLAHSAQSVGYGAGQRVERSQLQRGDIVCFNTVSDGDQSDHVGIYMGGNQFVHASSGQGRVVVSTISGYYLDNFSWGRRVL